MGKLVVSLHGGFANKQNHVQDELEAGRGRLCFLCKDVQYDNP